MLSDSRLQRELDAGETLLWQGAPDPARLARRQIFPAIFGGCFALFALMWMAGMGFISAIIAGATGWKIVGLAPLFGLIFFGVGVALLLSPLTARRRGARTIYALTARRILIIDERQVRSLSGHDLNVLERRDAGIGPDGQERGDLIFRRDTHFDAEGGTSIHEAGFFGIQNPREVERLIRLHLRN